MTANNFQIGDRVICLSLDGWLGGGWTGTVVGRPNGKLVPICGDQSGALFQMSISNIRKISPIEELARSANDKS